MSFHSDSLAGAAEKVILFALAYSYLLWMLRQRIARNVYCLLILKIRHAFVIDSS